jgi:hypothetical protein
MFVRKNALKNKMLIKENKNEFIIIKRKKSIGISKILIIYNC